MFQSKLINMLDNFYLPWPSFQTQQVLRSPILVGHFLIVSYHQGKITHCFCTISIEKAFEIWNKVKQNKLKPIEMTYNSLMIVCARNGDIDKAFEVNQPFFSNTLCAHKGFTVTVILFS